MKKVVLPGGSPQVFAPEPKDHDGNSKEPVGLWIMIRIAITIADSHSVAERGMWNAKVREANESVESKERAAAYLFTRTSALSY